MSLSRRIPEHFKGIYAAFMERALGGPQRSDAVLTQPPPTLWVEGAGVSDGGCGNQGTESWDPWKVPGDVWLHLPPLIGSACFLLAPCAPLQSPFITIKSQGEPRTIRVPWLRKGVKDAEEQSPGPGQMVDCEAFQLARVCAVFLTHCASPTWRTGLSPGCGRTIYQRSEG